MDCWLDKPVNQAKLRSALERLEAGTPLWRNLPPCSGASPELPRAACGLSQPEGRSLRPLGVNGTEYATVRSAQASQTPCCDCLLWCAWDLVEAIPQRLPWQHRAWLRSCLWALIVRGTFCVVY